MNKYPQQLPENSEYGPGERWRLAGNEVISQVHDREICVAPCTLHHPSAHHMLDFRLHYRHDRLIFERICEHGIGHPDPDTKFQKGDRGVHGCDGCCEKVEP